MVNLGVTGTVTAKMELMSWDALTTPALTGSSNASPREYVFTKVSLTKKIYFTELKKIGFQTTHFTCRLLVSYPV